MMPSWAYRSIQPLRSPPGVGLRSGTAFIPRLHHGEKRNCVGSSLETAQRGESVTIRPLDVYDPGSFNFIKIDVERVEA